MFLYTIHDRTTSPDDLETKELFNLYMTRFKFYNRGGKFSKPIEWKEVVEKLIEQGFIKDLRTPKEKEAHVISLSKLVVTEKFTDLLFVKNGLEYWWDYFFELWQENACTTTDGLPVVTGTNIYILKPNTNDPKLNSIEKIKNMFWDKFCLKGNKEAINTFFAFTESYLKENGANMKIANFFCVCGEMMKSLSKKN